MIEARLRDQGVGQACLETSAQKPSAKLACALPKAVENFESRDRTNQRRHAGAYRRVAEEFGHNHWWKYAISKPQRGFHSVHVTATFA